MNVQIKITIEKTKEGDSIASGLLIEGMKGNHIILKAKDAERIIKSCKLKISSAIPTTLGTVVHYFQ